MGIGCSTQSDAKKCNTELNREKLSIQAFLTRYMEDTHHNNYYTEYTEFKKLYPNIQSLTEYKNAPMVAMGGTLRTRRQRRQRRRTRRNEFF